MSADDVLAIQRVLAEYCQLVDDGVFDRLVEVFTPDGTFTFGSSAATGRDDLLRWFEEAQPPHRRGKHVCSNPIVDIDTGGDRAGAVSDYLFVRWKGGALTVELAGRYRDTFVRTAGRWRIAHRHADMLLPPA